MSSFDFTNFAATVQLDEKLRNACNQVQVQIEDQLIDLFFCEKNWRNLKPKCKAKL